MPLHPAASARSDVALCCRYLAGSHMFVRAKITVLKLFRLVCGISGFVYRPARVTWSRVTWSGYKWKGVLLQAQRGGTQLGRSGTEAIGALSCHHPGILHSCRGPGWLFDHSKTAAKCSAAWRCSPPWRRAADLVCCQITRVGCPCECVLCHSCIALVGQRCVGRNGHSRLPQQWLAGAMAGAARRMGVAVRGAHQGRPDSGAAHLRCFSGLLHPSSATLRLVQQMESISRAV
jgi:hypothetical protein